MKKLVSLLFILLLAGCTVQTETVYVVDDETKAELLEQLRIDLKDEFKIEYQPSLTEIENMILDVVDRNSKAFIGVSNLAASGKNSFLVAGTGSGVIYDYDNENEHYYAITNAHVVQGADKVEIVLNNGDTIEALPLTLKDTYLADTQSDIAVIRFAYDQPLKVADFVVERDGITKGQLAIAMGNPLGYDYFGSVTFGVVSGSARGVNIDYNDDNIIDWKATLIQHDVAISPGNSGGPLFDLSGRVIGINNMKIVEENVSGIGFSIPSYTAIEIADILREKGSVSRAQLGITGNDLKTLRAGNTDLFIPRELDGGIYITEILDNGSVDGTGILKDDIIIRYNGEEIVVFDDLRFALDNSYAGDEIDLVIYRDGQEIEFQVLLKEKPSL